MNRNDAGASGKTPPLPHLLMWVRTDVPGSEIVVFDDREGLHARGSQHAVDPVPYALTYELWTDKTWATTRLTAHCEGAWWSRDLELTRTPDGWESAGSAHGAPLLAAFDGAEARPPAPPGIAEPAALKYALDIDIGGSPLTNALPVRRLALLSGRPGRTIKLTGVWVLPPTLEVMASAQSYRPESESVVRYGDAATAVLVRFGADGWVDDYPGLVRRVATG
jgi:hypothetical protein